MNNAAQTIAKPPAYFGSLRQKEKKISECLAEEDRSRIGLERLEKPRLLTSPAATTDEAAVVPVMNNRVLFPADMLDEHGEQMDLRLRNSWTLNLDEVGFKTPVWLKSCLHLTLFFS